MDNKEKQNQRESQPNENSQQGQNSQDGTQWQEQSQSGDNQQQVQQQGDRQSQQSNFGHGYYNLGAGRQASFQQSGQPQQYQQPLQYGQPPQQWGQPYPLHMPQQQYVQPQQYQPPLNLPPIPAALPEGRNEVSFFSGSLIWFIAVMWMTVGMFIVAIPLALIMTSNKSLEPWFEVVALIVMHGGFILIVLFVLLGKKKNPFEVLRFISVKELSGASGNVSKQNPKGTILLYQLLLSAALGLACFLGLFITWVGWASLLEFIGVNLGGGIFESSGTAYLFDYVLFIVLIGIMPSISEEVLMRGGMLRGFEQRSKMFAILMTGLMFMLFHTNPFQTFPHIFLGFIFAYVVIETNSLWSGMILHFVYNSTSVILDLSGALGLLGELNNGVIWLILLGLAVVFIPVIFVILYLMGKLAHMKEGKPVNEFNFFARLKSFTVKKDMKNLIYQQNGGYYQPVQTPYGWQNVYVPQYAVVDRNATKNIWAWVFIWVGIGVCIVMWLLMLGIGLLG